MPTKPTGTFLKSALKLFLITVAIPAGILAGGEVALRISGVGYPASLFIKEKLSDREILRANYRVGYRFFPGKLARKPLPEIMPAVKPAGRLRFFVLGESAARGEQLADFSFSRMLEAAINDHSPEKKVEVINTGIPAINSWVLREFADEVLDLQPDLLIIYAGHNEFIGPYGPASVFGLARNRLAALTGIWASTLRLVQVARSDTLPADLAAGWQGLEMFLKNLIMPDSDDINFCRSNWQSNLESIFAQARKAGVPVLWCRVPVNQLDCPPFASDERRLSDEMQSSIAQARQKLQSADARSALNLLNQLLPSARKHAMLNYLTGQANLALGNIDAARQHLTEALSNDCFRVRTTPEFNDDAAVCASRYNVIQADLEKLFESRSKKGIIDSELVYDHVHLSLRGHYLSATGIFNAIASHLPDIAAKMPASFPTFEEMVAMIGFTDHDAIDNLNHIINSMSRPPFTTQYTNEARLQKFSQELELLQNRANTENSIVLTGAAAGRQPQNWAALHRLALLYRDVPSEAARCFARAIEINPYNIDLLNNYGLLQLATGQHEAASDLFQRALALAPDFAKAHHNLGLLFAGKSNETAALRHYSLATAADPGMAVSWRNMANIHFRSGNFAEALEVYSRAVKFNADDLMLRLGIGNSLMQLQRSAEGKIVFAQAIASFAASPLPYYSLALAHEKENEYKEAAQLLQKSGQMGNLKAFTRLFELYFAAKIELNADELKTCAEQACRLSDFSDPWFMQILAAGYLEAGQKTEGAGILHRALALAQNQGKTALAKEIADNIRQLPAD